MKIINILFVASSLLLVSCMTTHSSESTPQNKQNSLKNDVLQWLEEIESPRALSWAKEHSDKTEKFLEQQPSFSLIQNAFREAMLAEDRIPIPRIRSDYIYNFWQDEKNIRGLWRRTSYGEYLKKAPRWETLIDFDRLAKKEKENWVFEGATCLPQKGAHRCLISLSRGGKDAKVVREFDVHKKSFVKNGFELPEAKSTTSWMDENTLFVGTDEGAGSLTQSGYPRFIRVWKRGTNLKDAPLLFKAEPTDISASGFTDFRPEGAYSFVIRGISFYESEIWYLPTTNENGPGQLVRIPLPKDANFQGVFAGRILAQLRSDWTAGARHLKKGALIALPLAGDLEHLSLSTIEVLFEPTPQKALEEVATTPRHLFLNIMNHVQGTILRLSLKGHDWITEELPLPQAGSLEIISSGNLDEPMILSYESFLQPSSYYWFNSSGTLGSQKLIKQLPQRFDSEPYEVIQNEATSKDGTRVPYFVVRSKKSRGTPSPTILYGYGGFEVSLKPSYLSGLGKAWLERGGTYVLANIRGGGEFGPQWHQAALQKNRHKAFEDFISVGEDLIAQKITTAEQLGIWGGSNGGLLVSAVTMMRPELFKAVVCEVPLTDMLRYNQLLAGASWMAEYGDPSDAKMREVLLSYSPYHNVKKNKTYPEMLIMTSTKDDRVHPGHARKLAARLEELGHPVLYYENIQGGHAGAANLDEKVKQRSLALTYFTQKLMMPHSNSTAPVTK